jgi:hypothetical protein
MKKTKGTTNLYDTEGYLASIKLSANTASPKGKRVKWTACPAEADPSQCFVPRSELLMEHETNGRLVKTGKQLTNKWKRSCSV